MTMEQYLKKLKAARIVFALLSITFVAAIAIGTISFILSPLMANAAGFVVLGVIALGAMASLVSLSAADKITQAIFFPERSPREAMPEVEVNDG